MTPAPIILGGSVMVSTMVLAVLARLVARCVFGGRAEEPTYDWHAAEARRRAWCDSPEGHAWREAFEQRHRETLAAYNAGVAEQLAQERRERQAEALALERQHQARELAVVRQEAEATQRALLADPVGHFLQWLWRHP